ncbi:hypothetical protein FACS18949_05120 [Clostridia bacterium]|nr:hypothetical protein FACS18949_05120 [Clostridia bacterium]
MDNNNENKERLYVPSSFEPVFLPPAEAARRENENNPDVGEPLSFTLSKQDITPSFAERDYSRFGYQSSLQEQEEKPKKKHPVLFGMLLGAGIALCAMLLMFFAMGGGSGEGSGFFPNPSGSSRPSASPSETGTMRPSGGGDETMDIVPAIPGRGKLTISEIAKKGTPSTVCIVVEDTRGRGGSASGIIMTESGYIITNCHVVQGAAKIDVIMSDGTEYSAILVGMDAETDLAVIKIEAEGLVPAEFGDSDNLSVGELVVVIGNPLGLDFQDTVTHGIISAINRDLVLQGRHMTVLQTNASVNPGNSGGPMFNEYGQVIGIISSKIMGNFSTSVEGLGFAIPITPSKAIVDELIERGYVSGRAAIGITNLEEVDRESARYYNIPVGVRVLAINEKCDAYIKGIRVDDIITKADGKEIATADELRALRDTHAVGDTMTVSVYRDGKTLEITFELIDAGKIQ